LYFQNWSTTPFVLNTTHSDTYGSYLTPSAVSPFSDGYNGPLVSGEKDFALVTEGGSAIATGSLSSTGFITNNLYDNGVNSQKKYRLRLYDNTVDASGAPGNYSETAFYAVRDNTPPNMLSTDTDRKFAVEKLLKFDNSTTAWDKTTPTYDPETP